MRRGGERCGREGGDTMSLSVLAGRRATGTLISFASSVTSFCDG